MSLRPDGTYRCDRCDVDIENAGIDVAVTISDMLTDSKGVPIRGMLRTLHLCRVNRCASHVLTKRALRAYLADQESKK